MRWFDVLRKHARFSCVQSALGQSMWTTPRAGLWSSLFTQPTVNPHSRYGSTIARVALLPPSPPEQRLSCTTTSRFVGTRSYWSLADPVPSCPPSVRQQVSGPLPTLHYPGDVLQQEAHPTGTSQLQLHTSWYVGVPFVSVQEEACALRPNFVRSVSRFSSEIRRQTLMSA